MELAPQVKFHLDFHWVTRPWRRTLTNGSDLKYVFPRCRVYKPDAKPKGSSGERESLWKAAWVCTNFLVFPNVFVNARNTCKQQQASPHAILPQEICEKKKYDHFTSLRTSNWNEATQHAFWLALNCFSYCELHAIPSENSIPDNIRHVRHMYCARAHVYVAAVLTWKPTLKGILVPRTATFPSEGWADQARHSSAKWLAATMKQGPGLPTMVWRHQFRFTC